MSADFNQMTERLDELPAMPMVAAKVLKMMQDPTADAEALARVISHDSVVAAQILKIANSSYYSMAHRVSTIEHAIVILGEKTMRSLVLAASIKGLNRRIGLMEKMLWEDSIGCAIAARVIASDFATADPEEAFMGGLLRHFGRMVMNAWNPEAYLRVMEGVYGAEGSLDEMERRHFPTSHAVVGAMVLRKWNFAENLVRVVLNHEDLGAFAPEESELLNLTATIDLAGNFCRRLGIGQRQAEDDIELGETRGARRLGLSRDPLEASLASFRDIFHQNKEGFLV